jgi:hypothetical protein
VTLPWQRYRDCVIVGALLSAACTLKPAAVQMYDGPPLPREHIAILSGACQTGPGLTIMILRIDGKHVPNACTDFALLPGDHSLELSAKRLAPKMDAPVITSGSMMGAPPSPRGAASSEELPVVWASTSPLTMTCTVHEGRTVIIVGRIGTGNDWHAECQSVADIN